MTLSELECIIDDYKYAPWMTGVTLGCECGCGGDGWTTEMWLQAGENFDAARKKLEELGIELDD